MCVLLSYEMVKAIWVQILKKVVCISHNIKNPCERNQFNYFVDNYEYIVGQTELFKLGMARRNALNSNLLNAA